MHACRRGACASAEFTESTQAARPCGIVRRGLALSICHRKARAHAEFTEGARAALATSLCCTMRKGPVLGVCRREARALSKMIMIEYAQATLTAPERSLSPLRSFSPLVFCTWHA